MIVRGLIAVLLCVALAPLHVSAASNEPVTSLRAIDKQLSTLNVNVERLKSAVTQAQRSRDLRRIRAAVVQIQSRARRLTSTYRARRQRFGVKMFSDLERKTRALSRSLTELEQARTKAERDRLLDRLTKTALPVVLQYEAISANIAANHCKARQWACCEPKSNPETNRGPAQGCRWSCVSKPRACVGFTGPQTPPTMVSAP